MALRTETSAGPVVASPEAREEARWARHTGSFLVLGASLLALYLIVHNHLVPQLFGIAQQQALPVGGEPPPKAALDLLRGAGVADAAEQTRYRALAEHLARRYRVSQEVTYELVSLAHGVGKHHGLDPLLIIAVIAVESSFNPIAESVAGAKGLMQVIPKYHTDKLEEFGGEKAVYDPFANVMVGAQILKEYLRRTGNLGSALQMYAGALGDGEDQYTQKVLNEKQRLQQVLARAPAPRAASASNRLASVRQPPSSPLD
ncbi:MAG TPA: transglycosylase SLT domain-containing protein [Burkholderiales bacterium]|nr:transglycosylase SLT domain-containing protein [Burkholderiales bacterium]